MSSTPSQEDSGPQPSESHPNGPPWLELAAAAAVAAPVGLLTDWPTAVQVLVTIFGGMISVRQVSDRR
ncbi:hypothetical protein ACIA8C_20690 [Nocardia sp. NPDC051321]|uniref:hypothetical protein n=1 Tax=Nocardia sp. NPDC051321 TaxID=3364323 RepID=UPI0037A43B7D